MDSWRKGKRERPTVTEGQMEGTLIESLLPYLQIQRRRERRPFASVKTPTLFISQTSQCLCQRYVIQVHLSVLRRLAQQHPQDHLAQHSILQAKAHADVSSVRA
jgi:hypothetical protein